MSDLKEFDIYFQKSREVVSYLVELGARHNLEPKRFVAIHIARMMDTLKELDPKLVTSLLNEWTKGDRKHT